MKYTVFAAGTGINDTAICATIEQAKAAFELFLRDGRYTDIEAWEGKTLLYARRFAR